METDKALEGFEKTLDYDEGDECPKCKKDILVICNPSENSGGLTELKCQGCNYDATEDEKCYAR